MMEISGEDAADAPSWVFLLSSGWASDDQYEHGVYSSVEKAKAAAPPFVDWEEREEPNRGHITHKGNCLDRRTGEGHPWWIEAFELDRTYQMDLLLTNIERTDG